jgi:error-prone DNA polymerase
MTARLMEVEGELERSKEGVMHIVARAVIDRSAVLALLTEPEAAPAHPSAQAIRAMCACCPSRDFH